MAARAKARLDLVANSTAAGKRRRHGENLARTTATRLAPISRKAAAPIFGGKKIRHHGDFHLGQILIAKDDAYILDFEGEPRRTLEERRQKAPPARDAAGFIRSIDYAISAALDRAPDLSAEDRSVLAPLMRDWGERLRAAFWDCYRETIKESRSVAVRSRRGAPVARLVPSGKGAVRNRIRTDQSAGLVAHPAGGNVTHPLAAWSDPAMNEHVSQLSPAARAIIDGRHADPFVYLGPHTENDRTVVRVFLPDASQVVAISDSGERPLERIDDAGLFAGQMNDAARYRLRARFGDNDVDLEDPYRFPPVLSDYDLFLLGEGNQLRLYDKLGAHPMTLDGVDGVAFAVLAPNAQRVSVVGDFNFWDGRRHAMRVRGNGYWEIFVPGAHAGDKYKYEIVARSGEMLPLKSDPVAFAGEMRPSTASVVVDAEGIAAAYPRARWHQRARPADVDLRGSSRLLAAQSERRRPLADLSRTGRAASGLCRRHGLYPCRIAAGVRTSVRRLLGLSADRHVSRRPAVSARRPISSRWSMPCTKPGSA